MAADSDAWGSSGKDARLLAKFHQVFSRTGENDRQLLLLLARKMAGSNDRSTRQVRSKPSENLRARKHG
jgi:hypothetical protein